VSPILGWARDYAARLPRLGFASRIGWQEDDQLPDADGGIDVCGEAVQREARQVDRQATCA
jgi:hypothetical protein